MVPGDYQDTTFSSFTSLEAKDSNFTPILEITKDTNFSSFTTLETKDFNPLLETKDTTLNCFNQTLENAKETTFPTAFSHSLESKDSTFSTFTSTLAHMNSTELYGKENVEDFSLDFLMETSRLVDGQMFDENIEDMVTLDNLEPLDNNEICDSSDCDISFCDGSSVPLVDIPGSTSGPLAGISLSSTDPLAGVPGNYNTHYAQYNNHPHYQYNLETSPYTSPISPTRYKSFSPSRYAGNSSNSSLSPSSYSSLSTSPCSSLSLDSWPDEWRMDDAPDWSEDKQPLQVSHICFLYYF